MGEFRQVMRQDLGQPPEGGLAHSLFAIVYPFWMMPVIGSQANSELFGALGPVRWLLSAASWC